MARRKIESIYGKEIREVNVTDLLGEILMNEADPGWDFELSSTFKSDVEKLLKKLDFYYFDYITGNATYWSGVLTLEPFHTLGHESCEPLILNHIKNDNLQLVERPGEGLVLRFYNPTSSQYYRFFNQHKETGYGLNVTSSMNALINRIVDYLKDAFSNNLSDFGQWIPNAEDEEEIA